MAVEERGGRKNYYYRKKRIGNRVISIYGGSGAMAILAEMQDTIQRANRRQARKVSKAARDQIVGADQALRELCEDLVRRAEVMARSLGICRRRGEWRRQVGQPGRNSNDQ